MSFRTSLLPIADSVRKIRGALDMAMLQLTIITRVWSGGYRDSGTPVDTPLVISAWYKSREVSSREVASSGGNYEKEDIVLGPITPNGGGASGFTLAQLIPEVTTNGTEIIYRLSGVHAGDYMLVDSQTTRPFRYMLILRRMRTTP
jgi:hypothetical protein